MWMRWALVLAAAAGISLLIASCGDSGSADTLAVVERALAAYEDRDAAAYAALFADDGRFDDYSAFAAHVQGRDRVEEEYRQWFAKVVPANHTFESKILIADEHMVVVEVSDEWSEDGKTVRLEGIGVYEVEDGEIVRDAEYYDSKPVERWLD